MTTAVADRRRIVEIVADLGKGHEPRWRYGSGFLVGGREVLTSAHVVHNAEVVRIRTPDKASLGADLEHALVGEADPLGLDLALLTVPCAEPVPYVPIARVNRDSPIGVFIDGCAAVGYPLFQETARGPDGRHVRETAQVSGRIAPLSGLVEGLVSFEVTSSPQHALPAPGVPFERTEWSGMSGAAVFAPGPDARSRAFLIGVVAEHATLRGPSSITVLPLERLFVEALRPSNAPEWWARLGVADPSSLPEIPPRAEPARRSPFEPDLLDIPAGEFWMGADDGAPFERPATQVALAAYALSRRPITNAQFEYFARDEHFEIAPEVGWTLASVGQEPPADERDHPVVGLSWDEARTYCDWLRKRTGRPYRLPTEAEWERAARGGDRRRYPWGDAFDTARCNTSEAGLDATTPVGAYSPAGDSPYGCADMCGNVMEWTSTMWGAERAAPRFRPPYRADDGRESQAPSSPFREFRVCRGGSFRDTAERSTSYARSRRSADARDTALGFRVALSRAE
jgi:formylglycine-generating enzyme required for sulfatase activity